MDIYAVSEKVHVDLDDIYIDSMVEIAKAFLRIDVYVHYDVVVHIEMVLHPIVDHAYRQGRKMAVHTMDTRKAYNANYINIPN